VSTPAETGSEFAELVRHVRPVHSTSTRTASTCGRCGWRSTVSIRWSW